MKHVLSHTQRHESFLVLLLTVRPARAITHFIGAKTVTTAAAR